MLKDVSEMRKETFANLKKPLKSKDEMKTIIDDALTQMLTKECKALKNMLSAKNMFFINKEKKTVCLKTRGGKVQLVKCHEDDTFDEKIGIALAVDRMSFKITTKYGGRKHKIQTRRFLKSKLNIEDYSDYVLAYFWEIETTKVNDKIKELKEKGEIKYVGGKEKQNEQ